MEELYRALYNKYATGLNKNQIEGKIQYALTRNPAEFINAFYKKYTGEGPNQSQANYIKNYLLNVSKSEVKEKNYLIQNNFKTFLKTQV